MQMWTGDFDVCEFLRYTILVRWSLVARAKAWAKTTLANDEAKLECSLPERHIKLEDRP